MTRSRRRPLPTMYDTEGTHVWPEALPGVVMIRIKRDHPSERRAGFMAKRMFCELSISEAVEHHRALGEAIREAGARGSATPGGDSAPPL